MIDKRKIHDDFVEILACYIDVKEQMAEDQSTAAHINYDRWRDRYIGRIPTDGSMVFNRFKPEVDELVCRLMLVIDEH